MLFLTILLGCLITSSSPEPSTVKEIKEAVLPYLQPYCQESRKAEVRLLRLSGALPAGGDVRAILPSRKQPVGRIQVLLEHRHAGEATYRRAGYAMVEIAWYDSVVVARELLPRNISLTPDHVAIVWKDITRFSGEPLTASAYRQALARGRTRLTRMVRPGAVLRTNDLAPALAADTGTPVLMEVKRPGLHITLSCTARQPGHQGMLIRVYCPDTHQHYRARLIAEGKALWIQTLK